MSKPSKKLKRSEVAMEDINHVVGVLIDSLVVKVNLTEEEQERVFESVSAQLEEFFGFPDYRHYG